MRQARRRRAFPLVAAGLITVATITGTAAAGVPAFGSVAARGAAPVPATKGSPTLRLIAAQHNIDVPRYGKYVYAIDPGIWVAATGAPLRLDVKRASYTKPVWITQVVRTPSGLVSTRLPRWMRDGWNGLRNFARLTVRNQHGKIVLRQKITFCPDSYSPERTGPSSAPTSPYPQGCGAGDPFPLSTVWGIAKGWAVDPSLYQGGPPLRLALGRYRATETISPRYVGFFRIPARAATKTVILHVVKAQGGCCIGSVRRKSAQARPLASLPRNVPLLRQAPKNALPDLIPLPSWGINTSTVKKTRQDYLNFGATVSVGGTSPLDVEGFRKAGSPTMLAYQYYWHNGRIVGRTRAGTMGFDSEKGHHHWHFQQFARYALLNASKKVAVRSKKVGFCIAPTDAVNLLLPHATWQPSSVGLSGQCGSPTALWVQELMPIGWADTYDQYKAGQAFNITHLPDGAYYVEIIANPEHVLHEVTRSNDISLRKVIITGTPGHRHVRVPAWHGIDPEG